MILKRALFIPAFAAALSATTLSSTAAADALDPTNERTPQISIGSTTDSHTLQEVLTGWTGSGGAFPDTFEGIFPTDYYGYTDAAADQHQAGMWKRASPFGSVNPLLYFEFSTLADDYTIGLFSTVSDNPSDIRTQELFSGSAAGANDGGPAYASIFWNVSLTQININGVWYANNIDPNSFGFYVDTPTGRIYSVDQLNGGSAKSLAYQGGDSTNWAIAFEADGDSDFNDVVLYAESLLPVPEPGSLMLLGSGLVGIAGAARRRFRRKA